MTLFEFGLFNYLVNRYYKSRSKGQDKVQITLTPGEAAYIINLLNDEHKQQCHNVDGSGKRFDALYATYAFRSGLLRKVEEGDINGT